MYIWSKSGCVSEHLKECLESNGPFMIPVICILNLENKIDATFVKSVLFQRRLYKKHRLFRALIILSQIEEIYHVS